MRAVKERGRPLSAPPPMYNVSTIKRKVKVTPKPALPPSLFEKLNSAPCTKGAAWPPTSTLPPHLVTRRDCRRKEKKGVERSFLEACTTNKPWMLEAALKAAVPATTTYPDGIPALHKAVERGFIEIVRVLLGAGEQVDRPVSIPDEGSATARNWTNGDTALHRACACNNIELTEYLIEAGGNIQAKNCNKQMPMHYAARSGALQIVQMLHKLGVDVNQGDGTKRTALHEAAANGQLPVVEWLCKRMKPRVRKQSDRWGKAPIHLAAYYGHKDVVEYLVNFWGADMFKKDNKGQTPAASTVHLPRAASSLGFNNTSPCRPQTAESRMLSDPPPPPRCATPSWVLSKLDTHNKIMAAERPQTAMSSLSMDDSGELTWGRDGGQARVAKFLQSKVEEAAAGQESAGLKKTLGPGVNMTNVAPTIIAHQRRLAMLTELQEAIDAETHLKGCLRAIKDARGRKQPKLKEIRDAEMAYHESYTVFVKEVGEAKHAVGQKMVLSRIPQSRMNTFAKMAAECRKSLNIL